jgi:hypothetical protein
MNTVYLIFISHFRTGEDNMAKIIRNTPITMKQKNIPKIMEYINKLNILPKMNPDIDSASQCFKLKWITLILQVNYTMLNPWERTSSLSAYWMTSTQGKNILLLCLFILQETIPKL